MIVTKHRKFDDMDFSCLDVPFLSVNSVPRWKNTVVNLAVFMIQMYFHHRLAFPDGHELSIVLV